VSELPQLQDATRKFADRLLRLRATRNKSDKDALMYVRDQDSRKLAEEKAKESHQKGKIVKGLQVAMDLFLKDQ